MGMIPHTILNQLIHFPSTWPFDPSIIMIYLRLWVLTAHSLSFWSFIWS